MTGEAFLDALLAERFPSPGHAFPAPEGAVLRRIVAHRHPAGHWHYTSYGYSELDEKSWPDPDFSGYGMEMTFRLADDGDGDAPPAWPVGLFEEIATYAFDSQRLINPGDHLLVRSRLADTLPGYAAVLCSLDPELETQYSPNGRIDFVQITAIVDAELQAVRNGRLNEVLHFLSAADPLRVTRADRAAVVRGSP